MSEEHLPYIQITQLNEFVIKFPKEYDCDLNDLHQIFGKSKVSNLIPALNLLRLIDYNKRERKISLSELGRQYRIALVTDNETEASNMLKNIVKDIDSMNFIRKLLEAKHSLTSEEIGKQLAFKYSKNWKNPSSFKIYGSSVASILGFCNFGIYSRGILRKGIKLSVGDEKPVLPSASFNVIFKITRKIFSLKETDLDTLTNEFGRRVSSDLSPCVELGLVERTASKRYHITTKGEKLVYEMNQENIPENWREILQASKYWRYISLLEGKEITTSILGDFLNKNIGGKWGSQNTAKTYAKKFLTWLNNASLIEKIEQGRYLFKDIEPIRKEISDIKSREELNKTFIESSPQIKEINVSDAFKGRKLPGLKSIDFKQEVKYFRNDLYELGKSVGVIQSSSSKDDVDQINKAVKIIIEFCSLNEFFKELLDLFNDHFELFQELKDTRIFLSDIKLLEKKLEIYALKKTN